MEIIPVKTRILHPPQDDLYRTLLDSLPELKDGDIIAVSSKVVAIHEGHTVPAAGNDKQALALKEADYVIERDYWPTPLTIIKNAFIGTAGVDASNAGDHYVLLPEDAFRSAHEIRDFLVKNFEIEQVGVVITDSHSTLLRRGAIGISIGYHGFNPTKSLVGEPDLFGRNFKLEVVNLADSIAAAANLAMGEGAEGTPVAVIRGLSGIEFTATSFRDFHMVGPRDDTFRVLYRNLLDKK